MAPGRIALGRLIGASAVLAVVVAGCGGGSSSASGTTRAATAAGATGPPPSSASGAAGSTAKGEATTAKAGGEEAGGAAEAAVGAVGKAGDKRKHPPIELPTSAPEEAPPKSERPHVPTVAMKLAVPRGLTVAGTCKGKNVSPELVWGAVPPATVELAVFAVNMQPVGGELNFDWAMAGIDPGLEGLKEGEVPRGAVLGRNADGQDRYSLCPPGSKAETYVFSVYAITRPLAPRQGFEPLAFRTRATRASEQNGIAMVTYAGD